MTKRFTSLIAIAAMISIPLNCAASEQLDSRANQTASGLTRAANTESIRVAAVSVLEHGDGSQAQTTVPLTTQSTANVVMNVFGPEVIKPGEAAKVRIALNNDGTETAELLRLSIQIPANVRIKHTEPKAVVGRRDLIEFHLAELRAKDSAEVSIEFVANDAGSIQFQPRLTVSTSSQLTIRGERSGVEIEVYGDPQVQVDDQVIHRAVVRNIGENELKNLTITQIFSDASAVTTVTGRPESKFVPQLSPGATKEITFKSVASQTGVFPFVLSVNAEGLRKSITRQLTIIKRDLRAKIEGPELTYVNSEAIYRVAITNDTNREQRDVYVNMNVPINYRITVLDRNADYRKQESQISWRIDSLPANRTSYIQFKATPVSSGMANWTIATHTGGQLAAQSQLATHVITRDNLQIVINSPKAPIAVGAKTPIHVTIENRGMAVANDISLYVDLPHGINALPGNGYRVDGNRVRFHVPAVASQFAQDLTLIVEGSLPGQQTIRATLEAGQNSRPVTVQKQLDFFSGKSNRIAIGDENSN